MLKNILKLGKALNKAEQKEVAGGGWPFSKKPKCCDPELYCCNPGYVDPNTGIRCYGYSSWPACV